MSDESPSDTQATPPSHRGPEHAEPEEFQREVWGTRVGFILAAVGSAVGLGNMWRFPYVTAETGGAAFVVLYIGLVFVVGIPVMLSEFVIGRRTHQSPISALKQAGGPAWAPLGYIFVLAGLLILAYYSVIAGWVARYALTGFFDGFPEVPGDFFNRISTGSTAIWFHLGFMALTIGIVMGGIEKGIERASLTMMPVLFVLLIGLAVWAATLAGSGRGYGFYLAPDLGALFSLDTLAEAAGQTFFSLSLGMGAMLTFASYLSRDESLPREGTVIAFSDFGVAFVAGLLVFPVIFALGLQGDVSDSTVAALFIALPGAFVEMGGLGRVVGFFFFLALFIGAVTSAISLLEVVTSSVIDEWGVQRKHAAVGGGLVIALLGLWPASDLAALDAMDQIAGNVLLVLGGLLLALFVGWRLGDDAIEEAARGAGEGIRPWLGRWLVLLRFVVPALLVLVLYKKIPDAWTAVAALFGG